jgi:uncharacterized membrane protein (DUF4010 family)
MQVYLTLAMSLGIGLLIGLQRERTESRLGGVRTFPLISLLGSFCGLLAQEFGSWIMASGFVALFGVLAVSDFLATQREDTEHGQTTEIAALLTFALGAYLVKGDRGVAALAAGVLVVLLHLKAPLHRFVQKMGPRDMTAIVQFVVITLIVLPLLPNRPYGPLKVLNPFDIWRMVVLIVGISLAGYIALKVLGPKAGAFASGVLGGLVSSTATTIAYARRGKASGRSSKLPAFVVQLASAMVYVRIIVIVAIIAPCFVSQIALPVTAMFLWMALISASFFLFLRGEDESLPGPRNPAELRTALVFGVVYALVLLATALVKEHFGSKGLYFVAGTSGLADMDAIAISISRQLFGHGVDANNAWRLLLVASMTNLIFKSVVSAVLGERRFALTMALFTAIALMGGVIIMWFWPSAWILNPSAFLPNR